MTRNLPPQATRPSPLHFKIRKVSDIKPVVAGLHMFSNLPSLRLILVSTEKTGCAGGVKKIRNWARSGELCWLKITRVSQPHSPNSSSCLIPE